jgi:hypothetical protein
MLARALNAVSAHSSDVALRIRRCTTSGLSRCLFGEKLDGQPEDRMCSDVGHILDHG